MTTTPLCEEGRPNRTTLNDTDTDHYKPRGHYAHTAWQANLARMARRAVHDPSFYDIAGGTVQRLADELRVERIAAEYYDGGDVA